MDNKSKKILNNHYSKLINKYGFNNNGMGWRKGKLYSRYNIFLKHLNLKNKNVLDFGAGIGSLYFYLKKKKKKINNYYPLEINKDLINFLKKKINNKKVCILKKNDFQKKKLIDIAISNGVHNYRTKNSFKFFMNDIKFLIKISKEAIAISFLNNNVDYKENYLSYKNIYKVLKFLQKGNLKFIIDQTFSKYETFLFIFKKINKIN